MTYTTLTYGGAEKSLADWGISTWSRTAQNQANDDFTFSMPAPMDGSDVFPYGAQIIIRIGRVASAVNPINPTLPTSLTLSPSLTYSGGTQWFWGYCVDNDRVGEPGSESFNYKFAGPYQFFFERLIFQKLMLNWNGTQQIADYQSDVILGLSLTTLTGAGDTIQETTATSLMSIAQQIKEICMYAQADSKYQQSINGLNWPGTVQFQCDQLTTEIDGINWDLLQTPSTHVLISDYAGTPLSGKTSNSTLPAGSYILRPPLDAANAITCAEAMRRELQWIGGIGSPVVWTDHSQTPPQLHIATRDLLGTKSLALTGIAVKNKIKKRTDLIPAAVHFKYKIAGSVLGQPYTTIINDVAAYIGGALVEGIGQLGELVTLAGGAMASANQTALMAAAKTATAVVQTFDFQGDQLNAAKCKITTQALNMTDPAGSNADGGFWASLFPELNNVVQNTLRFYTSGAGVSIMDAASGTVYMTGGAWTGAANGGNGWGYRVTDGQVAPWMLVSASPTNPVGGQTVKATITVRFQYTQTTQGAGGKTATQEIVGYHEKNITCTLTTLTSGTYYSSPSFSFGEPVPYGLAGYILALENIPQYEGAVLVQETEISDVCPIGNVLNITGGLAEWATMNACVQSVRYHDNGQTEITFGPARHLGPAQFVARFRNNIGPRWYNLIAGDPMNQANPGAAALGSNIPAQAPTNGGKNATFASFLTAINAQQGATGNVATLPAGVHIDTGAGGTPFTGATPSGGSEAFSQGQAIVIAKGPSGSTPGESQAWLRLSIADLRGGASGTVQNKQIYLQEIPICVNVGGTLQQQYQLFLCSAPYATSLAGL
jgi:hypothetical protein